MTVEMTGTAEAVDAVGVADAVDVLGAVPGDRQAPADQGSVAGPADAVRWLSADEQRSWRAYLLGSARLTEALTRQLETEAQVSLSEYEILVRLSESEQRTLRMSELAASLVHSRSRLTHTVSRMERRGLVRRQNCTVDGRGVNCVLTDEGYALLRAVAPGHVRAVRAHLVDRLTPAQFEALGEAMAIIGSDPAGEPVTSTTTVPAAPSDGGAPA